MKKIIGCFIFLLCSFYSVISTAQILSGTARVYDPSGFQLPDDSPVTGNIDLQNNTMSVGSFGFFGIDMATTDIELLAEGTHSRPGGTVTVGPGQLGAYMTINFTIDNTLFRTFMVWDVALNGADISLIPVDSDLDGIPGQRLTEGPFRDFTLIYEFISPGVMPPGIDVSLNIQGRTSRACDQFGGSEFSMTANVILKGDTGLESVEWFLNNDSIGTGETLTSLIPVGNHTIKVVATNTTGQMDTASSLIRVYDFTAPNAHVSFVDARTGEEITSIDGEHTRYVSPLITVTDICDAEPDVKAVASPVYEVTNDSVIKIKGEKGKIKMPATGVEVRVTATDDAGNTKTDTHILPIE